MIQRKPNQVIIVRTTHFLKFQVLLWSNYLFLESLVLLIIWRKITGFHFTTELCEFSCKNFKKTTLQEDTIIKRVAVVRFGMRMEFMLWIGICCPTQQHWQY